MKLCYFATFAVTWTLADLAGRYLVTAKRRERRRRIRLPPTPGSVA
jgi:hypothetical protein